MEAPLIRLYNQISDRWASWSAVRRCTNLFGAANLTQFDGLAARVSVYTQPLSSPAARETQEHLDPAMVVDDELELAVAELSSEQRLLLLYFRQGATYREIASALQWSDERALHEVKLVLCTLADRLRVPG